MVRYHLTTTVVVGHFHSDFLFSLLHIIHIWNNTQPKMRGEIAKKGKFL